MSILLRRQKIRGRAIERNKGEGRELPGEVARCSSKKRKAAPVEFERASARADKLEAATSTAGA
jgi:hypothetical protein